MNKQVKIAVIGGGVIGLTTAIEIHRKFGHQAKVVIIADKFTPNTTSDIAAGLWEPYLLAENSEENVIRWSAATYQHILKLWKQGKFFASEREGKSNFDFQAKPTKPEFAYNQS